MSAKKSKKILNSDENIKKKIKDNSTRLTGDNYVKPSKSYTDQLNSTEIKQLLEDYIQKDINDITLNTHVRYFEQNKSGEVKFRLGGFLINNSGLPTYVVLSNGKKSWSVQVENVLFYSKLTINELKKEFTAIIKNKNQTILEQQSLIKKLQQQVDMLQKQ